MTNDDKLSPEYVIRNVRLKIDFDIDEDLSILDKLVSDGWRIQERSYYDAESGLRGTQLKTAYLEYYHKMMLVKSESVKEHHNDSVEFAEWYHTKGIYMFKSGTAQSSGFSTSYTTQELYQMFLTNKTK